MSSLQSNTTAGDPADEHCAERMNETLSQVKRGALQDKVLRSKKLTSLALQLTAPQPLVSVERVVEENGFEAVNLLDQATAHKDWPVFIGSMKPLALDEPADPDVYPAVRMYVVPNVAVTGHSGPIDHSGVTFHHELFDPRSDFP